jgi:hypothetical protein
MIRLAQITISELKKINVSILVILKNKLGLSRNNHKAVFFERINISNNFLTENINPTAFD